MVADWYRTAGTGHIYFIDVNVNWLYFIRSGVLTEIT